MRWSRFRFLPGLLAQLLSQLRNLLRQSRLLHRFRHRLSCGCPSFRSGIFIQADFSSSYRVLLPVRPLRSTGVTPFLSYLWASPTPDRAASRLCLPAKRCSLALAAVPGLPGSSTDLSTRAVPNHPGRPGRCICLLLPHRHFQASSCAEDWPPSIC